MRPLEGITVVEVGGPRTEWCGRLLSQAGARVILVEPPGGLETRRFAPFHQGVRDSERSLHFWHYNTDKESIVLDLRLPEDQDVFCKLVGRSQMLLDGYSPEELSHLGLTRGAIRSANDDLVHVAITPFGQDGPWAELRASDLVHQALGGQMMMNGYDDMPATPPLHGAGNQANHMAGCWAFIAGLSALYAGRGCFVDLSVHDACAGMTEGAIYAFDYQGRVPTRRTGRHASAVSSVPWQYQTGDRRYVLAYPGNISSQSWSELVQWMHASGLAADLGDDRYLDPTYRQTNDTHVAEVLASLIATKPAHEVFHEGQQRGMVCADIHYPEELLDDEQLRARQFWTMVSDESFGEIPFAGSAFVCADADVRPYKRAPRLNEHAASIRAWLESSA